MQVEFFSIPVLDPANATAALNRFLATHPEARVEKQLIDVGLNSVWAVCVTLPSSSADFTPTPASNSARSRNQNKVDYRAILPPHQWERFRQLRDLRKQVTTQDGVPAYAMALDEQLAEIVTRRPVSLADLTQIPGFGQARVEKYGQLLLEKLQVASQLFPDPSTPLDTVHPSSSPVASSTSPPN